MLPAFSVNILNIHLLRHLFKRDIFDHTDFNNCLAISNLYSIFDVLEDLVLSTVSPYRTVDTLCDILIQSCYCPGISSKVALFNVGIDLLLPFNKGIISVLAYLHFSGVVHTGSCYHFKMSSN